MLPVHGGNDGPAEPGTAQHHHRYPMSDHLPQVSEYLDPVEIKEQFQFNSSINNELKHRPLFYSLFSDPPHSFPENHIVTEFTELSLIISFMITYK